MSAFAPPYLRIPYWYTRYRYIPGTGVYQVLRRLLVDGVDLRTGVCRLQIKPSFLPNYRIAASKRLHHAERPTGALKTGKNPELTPPVKTKMRQRPGITGNAPPIINLAERPGAKLASR